MSHSDVESLAASDHVAAPPASRAVPETRIALQLLLELGMRIVDGDASALIGIAPALAIAIERLEQVHRSLHERALQAPTPYRAVLAEYAGQRQSSDLRELDALGRTVSEAQEPHAVGCGVVVAALVLLANLESDERWQERLVPGSSTAAAA